MLWQDKEGMLNCLFERSRCVYMVDLVVLVSSFGLYKQLETGLVRFL